MNLIKEADCEMKVVCGKQWTELNATEEEGIRFCGDCKMLVFYTKTAAELKVAAEKGLCVYIVPDTSAERADNFNTFANNSVLTSESIPPKDSKDLSRRFMGHVSIIYRDPDIY
jgi:RNA:NAD 2'-phosphotransferase (TPT1/KptA family)